ncbi:MAG: hypothetical protein M1445_18555 [Bacteroidetes bacterium]|nr:hypothetical protein [Bacteroidota bacterium]
MDEGHEVYKMRATEANPEFVFCPKCGSSTFRSKDGGRSFLCEGCRFQYYINNSSANLYPFSKIAVPTVDLAFVCEADHWEQMKPGDDVASIEFTSPEEIDLNALCSESMIQIIQFYLRKNDFRND